MCRLLAPTLDLDCHRVHVLDRSVREQARINTFATLHVVAGMPSKVVSDVLGHANIQQPADTYQHADQGVTADWMQRFEQQLDVVSSSPRAPVN